MKKSPSKALFWIRSSDSVMCENQIVLIIVLITLLKKKPLAFFKSISHKNFLNNFFSS